MRQHIKGALGELHKFCHLSGYLFKGNRFKNPIKIFHPLQSFKRKKDKLVSVDSVLEKDNVRRRKKGSRKVFK